MTCRSCFGRSCSAGHSCFGHSCFDHNCFDRMKVPMTFHSQNCSGHSCFDHSCFGRKKVLESCRSCSGYSCSSRNYSCRMMADRSCSADHSCSTGHSCSVCHSCSVGRKTVGPCQSCLTCSRYHTSCCYSCHIGCWSMMGCCFYRRMTSGCYSHHTGSLAAHRSHRMTVWRRMMIRRSHRKIGAWGLDSCSGSHSCHS